jgi:plasmid stability protein
MKNITLSVDEKVLKAARIYAAEHDTSVSALVREYLEQLSGDIDRQHDLAQEHANIRAELGELSRNSHGELGDWKWNREDIYRERFSRFEYPDLRRHELARRGLKEDDGT